MEVISCQSELVECVFHIFTGKFKDRPSIFTWMDFPHFHVQLFLYVVKPHGLMCFPRFHSKIQRWSINIDLVESTFHISTSKFFSHVVKIHCWMCFSRFHSKIRRYSINIYLVEGTFHIFTSNFTKNSQLNVFWTFPPLNT